MGALGRAVGFVRFEFCAGVLTTTRQYSFDPQIGTAISPMIATTSLAVFALPERCLAVGEGGLAGTKKSALGRFLPFSKTLQQRAMMLRCGRRESATNGHWWPTKSPRLNGWLTPKAAIQKPSRD